MKKQFKKIVAALLVLALLSSVVMAAIPMFLSGGNSHSHEDEHAEPEQTSSVVVDNFHE